MGSLSTDDIVPNADRLQEDSQRRIDSTDNDLRNQRNQLSERRKRRIGQSQTRRSTRLRASRSTEERRIQRNTGAEIQEPRRSPLVSAINPERNGSSSGVNGSQSQLTDNEVIPTNGQSRNVRNTVTGIERPSARGGNLLSNSRSAIMAEDRVAFNKVKADLAEALREKRVHLLSLSQFQERNKFLEKELHQVQQDKLALETMMKRSRRGKKEKAPIWSSDNLNGTPLARYQGICLAVAEEAKREATYITTESYCDELHDGIRKRNRTGSVVLVSSETAKHARVYVKLPDHSFGIVKVTMVLAGESDYFTSPFNEVKGFVRSCFQRILDGAVGEKMSENEKVDCIANVCAHKQTTQRFKSILMDNFGNRKKASLGIYLRALGYKDGAKTKSGKHSDQDLIKRKDERQMAYNKCYVEFSNSGLANTMHWRVAEFDELRNDFISSNLGADAEENDDVSDVDAVDTLFMNKAAKRTFQHFRGYGIPSNNDFESCDASILTLARADACITTMMKWITVDGKGGTRNTSYHEFYTRLVPIAMENIIKEVWDDLEALVPHEMRPVIGDSEANNSDPFGNIRREWTIVFKHPVDSYIYLLASPKYFRSKICSWYGSVKDCYIGRCGSRYDRFTRISSSMTFEHLEESDVEEELVGVSESQEGTGSLSDLIRSEGTADGDRSLALPA